jgi:hypothetical protein
LSQGFWSAFATDIPQASAQRTTSTKRSSRRSCWPRVFVCKTLDMAISLF